MDSKNPKLAKIRILGSASGSWLDSKTVCQPLGGVSHIGMIYCTVHHRITELNKAHYRLSPKHNVAPRSYSVWNPSKQRRKIVQVVNVHV